MSDARCAANWDARPQFTDFRVEAKAALDGVRGTLRTTRSGDVEVTFTDSGWEACKRLLELALAARYSVALDKRLTEAEAEARRLREREQATHGEGYDQAHDDVWEAPVCSVCGADHDADESAMCEGGEVVSFREWVEAARRLREQLDAARTQLGEVGYGLENLRGWWPDGKLVARQAWLQHIERHAAAARAALGVEGEPPPAREWPDAVGRCNPTGFNPTASSATWCRCCGAPQGWEPDRG